MNDKKLHHPIKYVYIFCQSLEKIKQVQCLEIKQKTETKIAVKNNNQSTALLLKSIKPQTETHSAIALQLIRAQSHTHNLTNSR